MQLLTTRNRNLPVKFFFVTINKGPFLGAKVGTSRRALGMPNGPGMPCWVRTNLQQSMIKADTVDALHIKQK